MQINDRHLTSPRGRQRQLSYYLSQARLNQARNEYADRAAEKAFLSREF